MQTFLTKRSQRVVVDGKASDWCHVSSGIPQGTVIGPHLFLTFINDLPDSIQSNIRLFADDCLIYRSISTAEDQVILQRDLNSLKSWADKLHKYAIECLTVEKNVSWFIRTIALSQLSSCLTRSCLNTPLGVWQSAIRSPSLLQLLHFSERILEFILFVSQVIWRTWKITLRNDYRRLAPGEVKESHEDFTFDDRMQCRFETQIIVL